MALAMGTGTVFGIGLFVGLVLGIFVLKLLFSFGGRRATSQAQSKRFRARLSEFFTQKFKNEEAGNLTSEEMAIIHLASAKILGSESETALLAAVALKRCSFWSNKFLSTLPEKKKQKYQEAFEQQMKNIREHIGESTEEYEPVAPLTYIHYGEPQEQEQLPSKEAVKPIQKKKKGLKLFRKSKKPAVTKHKETKVELENINVLKKGTENIDNIHVSKQEIEGLEDIQDIEIDKGIDNLEDVQDIEDLFPKKRTG